MIRLKKDDPRTHKRLALFILLGFIGSFPVVLIGGILYPPDYSTYPPTYSNNLLLYSEWSSSLLIIASALMAIKLADEREILPAGGFAIFSIAQGLVMVTNYEIFAGNSNLESLETTYQIYVGVSMLSIPAILLISTYSNYPRWLNLVTVISTIPYCTIGLLFLMGSRDFKLFDSIGMFSWVGQSFVFIMWGLIAWRQRYHNYN